MDSGASIVDYIAGVDDNSYIVKAETVKGESVFFTFFQIELSEMDKMPVSMCSLIFKIAGEVGVAEVLP